MSRLITNPCLTRNGVEFTVNINAIGRHCLVSKEALTTLSELKSIDTADADMMDVFHAFEVTIGNVACRLALDDSQNSPLVLTPKLFIAHEAQRH